MGLSLAQMWNVPRLFHYSLDHLQRQFHDRQIHPAIVLAIARRNCIPSLIRPAVESLGEAGCTLASWTSDEGILRYMTSLEIGIISQMKEELYLARNSLLDTPRVLHSSECIDASGCELIWEYFWNAVIAKKVGRLADGRACHRLLYIRVYDLLGAKIEEMNEDCRNATLKKIGGHSCWFAEVGIMDAAAERLMVLEHIPEWQGISAGDM